MSFTIVGELFGIVGLALTAWALVRTWNSADGKKRAFWTDELKQPLRSPQFGPSEIGYVTATLYDPTDDQAERIRRVEESIRQLQTALSTEVGERDKRDTALGDRVDELVDETITKPSARAREETRWAAIGLGVVAFGSVLQIIGTLVP